jgi:hypothetical protein
MKVNVNVKKKFIVNGKEYGSAEEMPENIRAAYEKALQNPQGAAGEGGVKIAAGKITFNGKEYENEAAMPSDERELYKNIMGSLGKSKLHISGDINFNASIKHKDTAGTPSAGYAPITPESSFSLRKILLGVGIAILFALLYYIYTHGSK